MWLKSTSIEICVLRQRFQCVGVKLLVREGLQGVCVLVRESLEGAIFAAHLWGVVGHAPRRQGTRARARAGGGGVRGAVRGRGATALQEVHALVASPLGSSVGKPNLSVTVNKND